MRNLSHFVILHWVISRYVDGVEVSRTCQHPLAGAPHVQTTVSQSRGIGTLLQVMLHAGSQYDDIKPRVG